MDEVPISHLQRRKIEGRVLMPFIEAYRKKFGDGPTRELVLATVRTLSAGEGARWAEVFGGDIDGLRRVAEEVWAGGVGMDVEVIDQTADRLDFDVTRCGYAEFYKELGLAELGYQIHCTRDFAMITGFNGDIRQERRQTIMEGAACCDFRFTRKARDQRKALRMLIEVGWSKPSWASREIST